MSDGPTGKALLESPSGRRPEIFFGGVRVRLSPAHILTMSSRWNLKHVMRVPLEVPKTPAARALALKLVTEIDLLRLDTQADAAHPPARGTEVGRS